MIPALLWAALAYVLYFFLCVLIIRFLVRTRQVIPKSRKRWVYLVNPGTKLYELHTKIGGFSCGLHQIMWFWPGSPHYDRILAHEQRHTAQQVWLGPLLPLLYVLCSLVLLCVPGKHWYYDNPFEIDARAAEGKVK